MPPCRPGAYNPKHPMNTQLIFLHNKAMTQKRYWLREKRKHFFPSSRTNWQVQKWTAVEAALRNSIGIHADTLISTEQLYRDLAWQTH